MSKLRSAAGYYHTNDPHYTVQLQPVARAPHTASIHKTPPPHSATIPLTCALLGIHLPLATLPKNLVGLGVLQNCSSDLTKLYCLNDGNVSPSMKEGWRWKFVPKHEVGSIWIAGGILSPTIRIAGGKMFPSMRIAGGSLPVLCSEFEGPGPGRRAEQQDNVGQ